MRPGQADGTVAAKAQCDDTVASTVGGPARKQSLAVVGLSFPVLRFVDFVIGIQTFGVAIDP